LSARPAETRPRTVSRVCVVTHGRPETVGDGVTRLARVAAEHGVELVLSAFEQEKHSLPDGTCRWQAGDGAGSDLAVVLGGDGTVLRALQQFLGTGTPVFAINYGQVGFLTTARADQLEEAVSRAFRGDIQVVKLPTLEVSRENERLGNAVNDAVVASAPTGRMAHFEWHVDDVVMGEIGCDAVVMATPSGSTAYNLSAGGPVLGWGLDGCVVTFVAPHSLKARSLVLPRGHVIRVVNRGQGTDAQVILDGHGAGPPLAPGDEIEVRLSDLRAHLALLPEISFLQRFRDTFAH
jgi:NAD+ kinase